MEFKNHLIRKSERPFHEPTEGMDEDEKRDFESKKPQDQLRSFFNKPMKKASVLMQPMGERRIPSTKTKPEEPGIRQARAGDEKSSMNKAMTAGTTPSTGSNMMHTTADGTQPGSSQTQKCKKSFKNNLCEHVRELPKKQDIEKGEPEYHSHDNNDKVPRSVKEMAGENHRWVHEGTKPIKKDIRFVDAEEDDKKTYAQHRKDDSPKESSEAEKRGFGNVDKSGERPRVKEEPVDRKRPNSFQNRPHLPFQDTKRIHELHKAIEPVLKGLNSLVKAFSSDIDKAVTTRTQQGGPRTSEGHKMGTRSRMAMNGPASSHILGHESYRGRRGDWTVTRTKEERESSRRSGGDTPHGDAYD